MGYFSNQFCSLLNLRGGNLFMGLLIIIIAAAVVYAMVKQHGKKEKEEPTALDILKQRLADGKISVEEFERLKNIIKE